MQFTSRQICAENLRQIHNYAICRRLAHDQFTANRIRKEEFDFKTAVTSRKRFTRDGNSTKASMIIADERHQGDQLGR